jgi:hypothetical protein
MCTKKPELYNANNEAYAMMDMNRWSQDKQAGSKLSDSHQYSDYYDYSKEVREAMKDFKPTDMRKVLPDGEWIITNEDQSWTIQN